MWPHTRTHARAHVRTHAYPLARTHARTHMHTLAPIINFQEVWYVCTFWGRFSLKKRKLRIGRVFKATPDKGTNFEFDQIIWGVFSRKAERERTTYPKGWYFRRETKRSSKFLIIVVWSPKNASWQYIFHYSRVATRFCIQHCTELSAAHVNVRRHGQSPDYSQSQRTDSILCHLQVSDTTTLNQLQPKPLQQ